LGDQPTLTIQKLKQKNIEVFESSQDEPLKEWSIYECITFEIEHKRKIYVLTDGRWFEIAKNFAEEIRSYLSELPVSSLDLPGADKEESEEAYNSNAAAERRENIVLMDRRLVQAGDARGKIEVCDLLTDSGEFVHIKRRTSSSKLSHLFAQGMVSAEEFLRDAHFRTRIREILRDLEPDLTHLIPEERPRPENYEIVYGVIAEQSDIWPLSLPFFSQLHLMQAARYLKTLGFKVSTLQIGWE